MNSDKFPLSLKSNNIFNDILLPLRERKTSPNDTNQYVFFYRYIGLSSEGEYIDKILNLHRELSKLENLYLVFNGKIEIPFNSKITDRANAYSKTITLDHFISGEIVSIFQRENLLEVLPNSVANSKFVEALKEVIKIFSINEKLSNMSIGMNFVIKLICWSNGYIPNLFDSFMTIYNPKIVYYGEIKKHEGYFLILLSLMGCDVLFINSFGDDVFKTIDKENIYSNVIEEANRSMIKDIKLLVNKVDSSSQATANNSFKTVIMEAEDIFVDILVPISKRKDFIENTVYPVYFQRYIGIEDTDSIENYYNSIFSLDRKLSSLKNGYVKFDRPIPMLGNEETSSIMKEFSGESSFFDLNKRDIFIGKILNFKSFPKSKDENMNSISKVAFKEVVYLYLNKEKNINASKIQNFIIKLLGWINKYTNELFKESIKEDNPKILYYGEIKNHDIYLLIYFSKLGCDIIYISSEFSFDKLFEEFDTKQEYFKLTKLNTNKPLEEFPIIERQVRKTTIAYNASQEIQQVIYGDGETGLFKARQYEAGITSPVGIKTTYDELKILWNEPARLRPEFKVENNTVYVPNLFVKINGIFENINDYWADYKYFIDAKNTYVVKNLPFTTVTYTKQDLYSSAFLLNDKGLVDEGKLFKSPVYKFGFLKNSLQNLIVSKINELILSKPFKEEMDEKLKLKILMTVISMDNEVLELIERFDFTSEVPKLVIYANSRESFSEEDIIIIAFMKQVGADIVVLTPTNYNNLELMLRDNLFDVIQLQSVAFELQIPNVLVTNTKNSKSSIFKFLNFKGGNKK